MKNFLRIFHQFWKDFFPRPEVLSSNVEANECLSRYIFSSKHIKKSIGRVSPQAFLPNPRTFNTSVYRTQDCSEETIWDLGRKYVLPAFPPGRSLHGRADLIAKVVTDIKLTIVPDHDPHPRHANIEGWPNDQDKTLQKAIELANEARFYGNK